MKTDYVIERKKKELDHYNANAHYFLFHLVNNQFIFIELIVLENAYHGERKYRFEDFFWTGSGDSAIDDDNLWITEKPSTIYKTKTIVSTIYIENPTTLENPVIVF